MHLLGPTLSLAATDLSRYLSCRHLIELGRAAAEGRVKRPVRHDPALDLLIQRGREHEQAYVDSLRARGLVVDDLREVEGNTAAERTVVAMQAGAGAIVQAALTDGRWDGRADVLLRIERESDLGPWSYEVVDTKLARDTRGATVLQLCVYTDLVGRLQGVTPERMRVVKPGEPIEIEFFRFADYQAYYRLLRKRLEAKVDTAPDAATYPEPVPHCEICSWWAGCNERRHDDDHLSLVAGMQALHAAELRRQGIPTLADFAERKRPLDERPERGSLETFERLHGQARIQLEGRRAGEPRYRLLPFEPDRGFALLPEPSRGDLFLDLEADPFVPGGGLEYLFGYALANPAGPPVYRASWATDAGAERRAFEAFVDLVMERWRQDPNLHVYHYSPYEPGALKRLMSRHATREAEVDRLLRGKRLVDLYAVTRQGLQASVEGYSLKSLEVFFGFSRAMPLRDADVARRRVDYALELGRPEEIPDADRDAVEAYNRDDCLATLALRDWLEERRTELMGTGVDVPRPVHGTGDPNDNVEEREAEVQEVYERLVSGLPPDRTAWDGGHRAVWLLANLLEYFRREEKCTWWEMLRLHDLDHEDLLGERKAVTGLRFLREVPGGTRPCPIHRYAFPEQEVAFDEGDKLFEIGVRTRVGSVAAIDSSGRTLDIKRSAASRERHPAAVLVDQFISHDPLARSLLDLARSVADRGVDGDGPYRAARDLLLRLPPRLRSAATGGALRLPGEPAVDAAKRLVLELDHGVLPIQGPPGSGKTHAGSRMIAQLVASGKRVGVTAVSHKVVRKLLEDTIAAGRELPIPVEATHKPGRGAEEPCAGLTHARDDADAIRALGQGRVVGGTCWLWASEDAREQLDYLFVDEAGQLSLAMMLAASRAARNIVLLGDPQQLEQPQQGAHPEGAEISALQHVLGERATILEDRGLFLDRTWRLHPSISAFTSEVYYEGRLLPRDGLERQAIEGATRFRGSGLFHVAVAHRGNQNASPEEVEAIRSIVDDLLRDTSWIDVEGARHPLGPKEILVVAPYNAQVGRLIASLPDDVRVGTVDKFQGQQAPVVIYSMTSSSVDDAPRGMSFLYDPHRFNVATSRARCVCIVVGSPALLEPDCRTPEQMRWANALCRFVELSRCA